METILRAWHSEDAETLARYANNPNVAKNLTDIFPSPYSLEDAKAFIKKTGTHQPQQIFAIATEQEAIGAIGLHPQQDIFRKNAELGYWLAEPFWGKGIMSKAVMEMVRYGFSAFDIDRIFAKPFGSNIGSQKVLEKSGFLLEARFEKTIIKLGEYQDELVYAIRKKKLKNL